MIVLLTLFPVVMLELLFLNPLLASLGMAEATFIGNLLSVATLGWVPVPPANRACDWRLRPMSNSPRWVTAAGVALIVGLYVPSLCSHGSVECRPVEQATSSNCSGADITTSSMSNK